MAKMLKIVLPLWLVLGMLPLRAQQWQSVDDASLSERERVHLSDYEVSIRTRDGHWQQVKVAGALVSNIDKRGEDGDRGINGTDTAGHARTLMGVAMLTHDFAQKGDRGVRVRVKRQGVPFSEVTIRPTAKRIKPRRIDGQTVEFSLDHPTKVSVEFDGDRDHNLFVFADTPLERPAQDDLIYFGPGEHEAGFINMHSGQTVFIDEGAVVYGQIDARGADHIRILGRGILCGSQAVHDFLSDYKGPGKLIENYNLKGINQDPKTKDIKIEVELKPFFAAKNFFIELTGHNGDAGVEWDQNIQ